MDKLIAQEIEEIIATGEKLIADASVSANNLGHERVQEFMSITACGGQLIRRLYGSNSQHSQMFERATITGNFHSIRGAWYRRIADIVGILKAVEHDIKLGMLRSHLINRKGAAFAQDRRPPECLSGIYEIASS